MSRSAPASPADPVRADGGPRDHPLKRLWRYARNHRREVIIASAWSVLNKTFDLMPPVLIGLAIDIVVEREDAFIARFGVEDLRDQFLVLAVFTVLVWVLESIFQYLYEIRWRFLAQTIQHDMRLDAYDHVQSLDIAYFEDRSTGGLMAVLNDDVNQLERFLDRGANEILQVLTTVVLIGAAFFVLVPDIAWLAFLPIPVIVWGSVRFQRLLAPRYAHVRARVGHLNHTLANNLSGIATIKAFTAEDRETERVRAESQRYREANEDAIRLSAAFVPLIRIAILVGFTFILVLGGFQALDGTLAVGTYSVLVFITQRLLWPLTRLGETFDLYQRGMASTNRLLDLIETDTRLDDGGQRLEDVRGGISFDAVRFAYPGGATVIDGLDLDIPAGSTTAIVGPTGAGKSTIVKLILRLYDPRDGAVRLDGVDLRELAVDDVRSAVGLVSQDVFLFHGTVRENIAYGRPEATAEEIEAAARIAEAHDFISAMPEGYETVVGERGQKLSGGQRQRVSIARAVLVDPPVLVLDEATSAVDNETEAAIQRSLEHIAVGRTTILIAHRLSTVRNADAIHVLAAGRVAESGTHEELIAEDGIYAALWRVQTGEREVVRRT
jgi:ATP-binding cassette, subfamily B, bacterial